MRSINFKPFKNGITTGNVVESLNLSTLNRAEQVRTLLPNFFQNLGSNFAAIVGTTTFNKFLTFEYVFYVRSN